MQCPRTYSLILAFAGLILLSETSKGVSWRGAPLAKTRWFLITECGYGFRISKTPAPSGGEDGNYHLEWELGLMKNVNPRWAIGGTGYYSADDEGGRAAIKCRVRRWVSPRVALDLSAGPVIWTLADLRTHSPGFTTGVSLMNDDLVGITFNYELVPYKYVEIQPNDALNWIKGTNHGFYGGIRFGSYVGAAVGVAIPTVVLVWVISVVGGD